MSRQYDTFINRHQPETTSQHCCASISAPLVARFIIRSFVPIIFGVSLGVLLEWGERKAGMHSSNALIEISDLSSCALTLISAYTIDALLNRCWPANPYHESDFFQSAANSHHTDATPLFRGYQNA